MQGIFCANFYWKLGNYPPCQKMWCGLCYTSSQKLNFHVKTLEESLQEAGNDPKEWERLRLAWGERHQNEDAFKVGRNGDHALIPFECDLCIFRKLKKMNPVAGRPGDDLLLSCIRRINLDAMWSRASSTVEANK